MNANTGKIENSEAQGLLDSSLLWMTVCIYGVGTVVYMWRDFVKVYDWLIA